MGEHGSAADALAYFRSGYNCAQSVLLAHEHISGLAPAGAARLMSGFGGGVGKSGGLCGALVVVVALIGLSHGREKAEQMDRQEKTYEYVRRAMDEFEKRFGSTDCRTLLGGDILAPGVKQMARDKICPELLEFCCQLAVLYACEEDGNS